MKLCTKHYEESRLAKVVATTDACTICQLCDALNEQDEKVTVEKPSPIDYIHALSIIGPFYTQNQDVLSSYLYMLHLWGTVSRYFNRVSEGWPWAYADILNIFLDTLKEEHPRSVRALETVMRYEGCVWKDEEKNLGHSASLADASVGHFHELLWERVRSLK